MNWDSERTSGPSGTAAIDDGTPATTAMSHYRGSSGSFEVLRGDNMVAGAVQSLFGASVCGASASALLGNTSSCSGLAGSQDTFRLVSRSPAAQSLAAFVAAAARKPCAPSQHVSCGSGAYVERGSARRPPTKVPRCWLLTPAAANIAVRGELRSLCGGLPLVVASSRRQQRKSEGAGGTGGLCQLSKEANALFLT